jgi:hypothetical protein
VSAGGDGSVVVVDVDVDVDVVDDVPGTVVTVVDVTVVGASDAWLWGPRATSTVTTMSTAAAAMNTDTIRREAGRARLWRGGM